VDGFKKWLLTEAAYGPEDIPDGVVVVRIRIAGRDPYFYFADADTLEELEEDPNPWSRYAKPHGSIQVYNLGNGQFRVAQVVASDGWGPLLHDLAMEYATANGKGLGPDTRENSPESMKVWDYYHDRRDDVTKEPSSLVPEKYKDWKASHFLYSKKNTVTDQMLADGTLMIIKS